jgi:hypothetical protein
MVGTEKQRIVHSDDGSDGRHVINSSKNRNSNKQIAMVDRHAILLIIMYNAV